MEALKGFCGLEDRRDGRQGCSFWFAFPYVPDAFVQVRPAASCARDPVLSSTSTC